MLRATALPQPQSPNPRLASAGAASSPEAAMPPELLDDLIVEIFLRLPPDDPACLLRASLVSKRWRRILGDPAFRRRHRALYPAPSVVGFVRVVSDEVPYCSRFVPDNPACGRPAGRDLPAWLAVDCRHGRALFVTLATGLDTEEVGEEEEEDGVALDLDFVVWDPLTDERRLLPSPSPLPNFRKHSFNAAVLCAAAASGSCDHRGCHGGPFRVAFVFTTRVANTGLVTSASLYSSETGVWSGLTSVRRPDAGVLPCPYASALVGDTLYFRGWKCSFEYHLGAQRLSVVDRRLPDLRCLFMASVDGKLGFFNVEKKPILSLCLLSQETAPDGVVGWARGRVIKLEALLPSEALLPPPPGRHRWLKRPSIISFAEGTDVILLEVPTLGFDCDVYMAELNSGRAKKIIEGRSTVYPYTSYCIPVPGYWRPDFGHCICASAPFEGPLVQCSEVYMVSSSSHVAVGSNIQ